MAAQFRRSMFWSSGQSCLERLWVRFASIGNDRTCCDWQCPLCLNSCLALCLVGSSGSEVQTRPRKAIVAIAHPGPCSTKFRWFWLASSAVQLRHRLAFALPFMFSILMELCHSTTIPNNILSGISPAVPAKGWISTFRQNKSRGYLADLG